MSASWSAITGTSESSIFVASHLGLIYRWNGTALVNVPTPRRRALTACGATERRCLPAATFVTDAGRSDQAGRHVAQVGRHDVFAHHQHPESSHLRSVGATGGKVFCWRSRYDGPFDGTTFVTNSVLEDLTGNNGAIHGLSIGSQGDATPSVICGNADKQDRQFTLAPVRRACESTRVTAYSETFAVGSDFRRARASRHGTARAGTPETVPTVDRLVKIASDGTNAYAARQIKSFGSVAAAPKNRSRVPLWNRRRCDIVALDSTHVWIVGGATRPKRTWTAAALFYNGTSVLVIPANARYTGATGIFRSVWASDPSNVLLSVATTAPSVRRCSNGDQKAGRDRL